ncbi:hypothetical protein D0962_35180 [Leptolyngbyaceae cyanobacterium CCMR0082]|uniref:Uncharacterized protein n=1 Tax=Adonisia turfae CCMR0082 TaxID=2304604 RepID=A0A6M0SHG3_9CYAN|nr:hypothetical protein [Adonisia turfae]MDV3348185.1 hypothetical protein [Leptothoe sp. LEGE 181152]NEZ67925.1 hypothetical protein [Adonisia turfae CCMR0082]
MIGPLTPPQDFQRYILKERQPVICEDKAEWREFMRKPKNILVAQDSVGSKFEVLTVFLGFNNGSAEKPFFFQTTIFGVDEHSHGDAATWEKASGNHYALLQSAAGLAEYMDNVELGVEQNTFTAIDIQVLDNELHFILESEEAAKKALSENGKHWERLGKTLVFKFGLRDSDHPESQ